jgi:iron complex outermembrane receptor protein
MMRGMVLSSVCVAAFVVGAGVALADAPQGPIEVVVTATPTDQRAQDVLQGVTTLDRAAVLDTLGLGLGDTLDRQPGIATTGFAAGASRPIIRGLGEDRVRVLSNGIGTIDVSTVSPDHAVTSEGLEAQAIEILRGPAAIAFGGNAIGGVVNVVDARIAERAPEKAFGAEVYGAVRAGAEQEEIAAHATWAIGNLVLHAEGFARASDDYEIPGFAFTPEARADAIAEGADAALFARGAAPNSFAKAQMGALGVSFVDGWGFIGAAVKRLDSEYGFPEDEVIALKQEGAPFIDMTSTRTDLRAGFNQPFWVFEKARFNAAFVDYEHSENEEGEVGTVFTNEGFEARLELTHAPIGRLRGVVGVTGLRNDVSAAGEEAFITPTEVEEIGAFIVEEWEISPEWSLEAGLRFDRKTLDNITVGERDFDVTSASLGGAYRPSSDWFFALTASRTERAPTELELFANGPHKATQAFEVGDPNLDKEIATSIEAKARFENAGLRVEANVFHIDFADYIALLDTGAVDPVEDLPIFAFRQQDATFTGGELTAGVQLLNGGGWTLGADASLDLVRAEFDRGGDVPRIPPLSYTLGLDGATGPFKTRVEYVKADDQDDVATFETPTPGYELINARLSISPQNDERFVITIDGRNLTDEEVREHTSFVKALAPRPGRTIRLAISSKF